MPFQKQNIRWYAQNSQCVPNSAFQNGKLIFPYSFSVKNTLDISSIKFKMWPVLFSVNFPNFQQWNFAHNFSIYPYIQNWNLCVWVLGYSQKYWKLRFNFTLVGLHNFSSLWKWCNNGISQCWLRLYFQISPSSLKSWKIDIFELCLL